MTRDTSQERKDKRLSRVLHSAQRLVAEERHSRALRLLKSAVSLQLESDQWCEARLLQIECSICLGQLAEAQRSLESIRTSLPEGQRTQYEILSGYALAMGSRARAALRRLVPVLQSPHLDQDTTAWARWIAGIALYRAGHYSWAKELLELSAAHYRLTNQRTKLAQVVVNLGLVAKNQGDVAAALRLLDEGIRLLPSKAYNRTRAHSLLNRGICLHRFGRIQSARTCFLSAQTIAREIGDESVEVSACNNLGHVYRIEGNYATAGEY